MKLAAKLILPRMPSIDRSSKNAGAPPNRTVTGGERLLAAYPFKYRARTADRVGPWAEGSRWYSRTRDAREAPLARVRVESEVSTFAVDPE